MTFKKGHIVSESTRKKISLAHMGKTATEETKRKISKSRKGKHYPKLSQEHKKRFKNKENHPMYNKHHSEESKRKMSLGNKGKHLSLSTEFKKGHVGSKANVGKHLSKEHKKKIGLKSKESWQNPKYRKRMIKLMEDRWQNPEYKGKTIKAQLKGLMKRPTSYEQRICDLCLKFNLPFIYRGDGGFLINFKNPDFVNEKDKVVIEVFYSYFKIRDYGSVENYKKFCRNKYNSDGWQVIFLDENDVWCDDWEQICLNKIKTECFENFMENK